ncbi:oxidoreductase [Arsenicicoccus sp. oral taxon 190]|uniref:oxidoreductase n=1 Tax=Arsenicicoccus sp. oral taxon 190 TaxID=1658671 RepID=UPI00067A0583|nr:oxidoreductase [Arsenicicoccus sp. oral taxon 190]AKT51082.1 short-chain dehydrogenase [Arsenicicoccus sp. oral taxon 190]
MSTWTSTDIPDQTGRVFVVTGANSGLGLETTRALVAKGAYVVMACRDTAKGEAARASLDLSGTGGAEVRRLDLASLASVRDFAEGVADWRIETLINNAGVMAVPFSRTEDGFEMQLGTNVLGHFALTAQLLPRLTDRVVWLSSLMHRIGRIDLADPSFERRRYNPWIAYGQSKLADLMLAYELQRRLTGARSPLRSMAAHPGYSDTNLQGRTGSGWLDRAMVRTNKVRSVAQSAADGALPELYAATVDDLPGGSFVGPDGFMEAQGHPRTVGSTAASHDRRKAAQLWQLCEEMTGVPFRV